MSTRLRTCLLCSAPTNAATIGIFMPFQRLRLRGCSYWLPAVFFESVSWAKLLLTAVKASLSSRIYARDVRARGVMECLLLSQSLLFPFRSFPFPPPSSDTYSHSHYFPIIAIPIPTHYHSQTVSEEIKSFTDNVTNNRSLSLVSSPTQKEH